MEHEHLVQGNYYHIFNRGNNRCNLFEKPEEYEHFLGLYDKYISPVAETLAWVLMPNHFHVLVYIKKDVVYKYSLETLERIAPDKIWFEDHKWETVGLSELSNLYDADRSKDAVRSEEVAVNFFDFDLSACVAPDNVKSKKDNIKKMEYNVKMEIGNLKIPIPYRHFAHLFNAYSRYLQIRTGRTGNLFERPFKRKQVENDSYLKQVILYIHNNPIHHGFCSHPLEYPWSSYITSISQKPTKLKRDEVINLFGDKENFEHQHNKKIDIHEIEKWLEIQSFDTHDFNTDNAVKSRDVDRLEEDVDLSASPGPDNVGLGIKNNVG